jgi:hypothetical protein
MGADIVIGAVIAMGAAIVYWGAAIAAIGAAA